MSIVEQYNNEGYAVGKSILPLELINNYINDVKTVFTQQLDTLNVTPTNDDVFSLTKQLFEKDLTKYLATLTVSSKLYSLYQILMHDNIISTLRRLKIVTPIWQTKPVIHCMANELKIPNGYHGVGPHQDWPTLQSSLNTFTTWIPFTHVTRDTFPMEIIPCSHLHGLCDGTQTQHYFEVDAKYFEESDFIPIEVEPGDVIFMSNFAIHRSRKVGTDLRLSVSMRFEDASEQHFIKHNYPFTEHRHVKREVLFENFPTQDDVREIYKD